MKENKFDISQFVDTLTIEKTRETLTNNFIKRRKELHLTQIELAKKSGVSYASIRRFENKGEISLSSLLQLANTINYLDDLYKIFSEPVITDINIK